MPYKDKRMKSQRQRDRRLKSRTEAPNLAMKSQGEAPVMPEQRCITPFLLPILFKPLSLRAKRKPNRFVDV